MNLHHLLENCQKGQSIFDYRGLLVGTPLTHEYYKIYCLLQGKGGDIQEIYYPFLFFSSPKQLIDITKIGLLAEKKGVQYLDLGIDMPDQQQFVIIFLDETVLENAYLLGYLHSLGLKSKNFTDRLKLNWMANHLQNTPSVTATGNYKFLYYRWDGMSPELKKAYRLQFPRKSPNIIEEIERKYKFVKEYDNFADFKKKLAQAKKDGTKMLKELRSEKGFQEYQKKHQVRPFKFHLSEAKKTGVLTPDMLQEISLFQQHLKKSKVTI